MNSLINHISHLLSENIYAYKSHSGGDISSAYLLQTSAKKYFLKVNEKPFALEMFRAEQQSLQVIENTGTIAVPRVHFVNEHSGKSFILMDFIESKRPDASDFQRLGVQLANLHQCTQSDFGFPTDNFIGNLPQHNQPRANWAEFYGLERILPQLQLALKNQLLSPFEIPTKEKAVAVFTDIFGNATPSLLHGDLWSGNFLIAADGAPYLIDPAAYYGHSAVDIAMSRLFGGFGASFYDAYHKIIPKAENYAQHIELYQLYYLLVHLNLFGSGYYSGVSSILKRYF